MRARLDAVSARSCRAIQGISTCGLAPPSHVFCPSASHPKKDAEVDVAGEKVCESPEERPAP